MRQKANYKGNRKIYFEKGDIVFARDYRKVNTKTWEKGVIEKVLGKRNYLIRTIKDSLLWKRHTNQLLKGGEKDRMADDVEDQVEDEVDPLDLNIKQSSENLEENVPKIYSDIREDKLLNESLSSNGISKSDTSPNVDNVLKDENISNKNSKVINPTNCIAKDRPRRNIKPVIKLNL